MQKCNYLLDKKLQKRYIVIKVAKMQQKVKEYRLKVANKQMNGG